MVGITPHLPRTYRAVVFLSDIYCIPEGGERTPLGVARLARPQLRPSVPHLRASGHSSCLVVSRLLHMSVRAAAWIDHAPHGLLVIMSTTILSLNLMQRDGREETAIQSVSQSVRRTHMWDVLLAGWECRDPSASLTDLCNMTEIMKTTRPCTWETTDKSRQAMPMPNVPIDVGKGRDRDLG